MLDEPRIVHILGAGVDKPLGMPLATDLLPRVAKFAREEGAEIATAIRTHLPHLRFNFERYTGEQGESFAETILINDSEALSKANIVLDKYIAENPEEPVEQLKAVQAIINNLGKIRNNNQIDDDTIKHLAVLAEETTPPSGGDFIINPRGIHLVPIVRQAFRKTFQSVARSEGVTDDQREVLTNLALSMMNIEELLGSLFAGIYTGNVADQKKYLFVAWLLWAYMKLQMNALPEDSSKGFYETISEMPGEQDIITLNYTHNFIPDSLKLRTQHFHGDCSSYIRLDTRDLIRNDEALNNATSPSDIAEFISNLNMSIADRRIFLPGIIPPLSVKPILCREHLEIWYQCMQMIDNADVLIVTGYSFAVADEHLNDLIRKRQGQFAKLIAINPDIETTTFNFGALFGRSPDSFTEQTTSGMDVRKSANLIIANESSDKLDTAKIQALLNL